MKQRLDLSLVARGLVPTRSQAESWIRLGKVLVNGQAQTKPGFMVQEDARLELQTTEQYVSRAGLKLASVAAALKLDFKDKVMLDVGSSTGGFTDYALQHGVRKVIAVELGTNQLHPSLHGDPRIELHEQTDIRNILLARTAQTSSEPQESSLSGARELASETLGSMDGSRRVNAPEGRKEPVHRQGNVVLSETPDIVVIDVSFVSLRDILPHVATLAGKQTQIIAMVKPQFEAAVGNLKHKGVIKNDRMRRDILKEFEQWARRYFVVIDKADSEIAGAKGNHERFYKLAVV